jgi:ribonuclease BN (tRNA processing enzyme)
MCEVIGQAMAMAVSRRSLLKGAGAAAAAGAVGAGLGPARASAGQQSTPATPPSKGDASKYRTRLVLLGVAGGPSVYAESSGISSALVVDGAVYLIDCGHGTPRQFVQAGLGTPSRPGNRAFEGLKGIFLTHLHSDHIVDFPAFPLTGMWNGLDDPTKPVQVHGPGDRGGLPPVFGNRPAPPVVEPADPTPGTVGMNGYLRKAFANDLNDRIRSSGGVDPTDVFQVHDIALPTGVPVPVDTNPMPPVDPFLVYEDDRVKVTATLVNHAPVFPSLAFRFDTADGTVTFSGDTAPSDNLVKLAAGSDILVHEIIDRAWAEALFPEPRTPAAEATLGHLLESHTTIEDIGSVAQRAGAARTVLSHMVPLNNPESRWLQGQRGYDGKLIVGKDLMEFGIGRRAAR